MAEGAGRAHVFVSVDGFGRQGPCMKQEHALHRDPDPSAPSPLPEYPSPWLSWATDSSRGSSLARHQIPTRHAYSADLCLIYMGGKISLAPRSNHSGKEGG